MTEIDKAYKEWASICRIFNRKEDPAIYSHKELFDFAKAYHKHMMQGSKLPMHGVSGIFMVEDRGKPLSFHKTKEGAEKAVKDWEESTISGEWNIVPIITLP